MSRSRSSFDLTQALASAASLAAAEPVSRTPVSLVSFGSARSAPPPPPRLPEPPESVPSQRGGAASTLPQLPDLCEVKDALQRCERIVRWIGQATSATEVFLADSDGLPLAGEVGALEERMAGAGLVATALRALLPALRGVAGASFEAHVGSGPCFQLIGFEHDGAEYMVGLVRGAPLGARQAHAVRLACAHALEPTRRAVR